jgi:hypothetical protein
MTGGELTVSIGIVSVVFSFALPIEQIAGAAGSIFC